MPDGSSVAEPSLSRRFFPEVGRRCGEVVGAL